MAAAVQQRFPYDPVAEELWHVAETGEVDKLDQIFVRRVDVNARNKHGMTALMRLLTTATNEWCAHCSSMVPIPTCLETTDSPRSHWQRSLVTRERSGS